MTPESIQRGMAALERLRGSVEEDVLDLALSALQERLVELQKAAAGGTAAASQRLALVTVMFVDVVGSTALGGKLDPEDIHLVMDPALARFTDIVQRCHGKALQYAGDSMLAAFGTDGTREDDAEMAVVAGLSIVREAQILADRVRREHQHPGFNVRVGLHTGHVLLGGGVDADKSIRGATVNLAARMEQNTQPGTLRISEDTHRSVQGLFDMDEQPPLLVKGYDKPMRTWLVRRRRALGGLDTRRGVAGVIAPLLGREPEMAVLAQAWKELHQDPAQVQAVTIHGEAGLGKTRLVQAWSSTAQATASSARWLIARAYERSQSLPFAVLRRLLGSALELPDDADPLTAREQWVATVRPILARKRDDAAATADTQVLGHLLGLDFSESPALKGILQQAGQIRQRGLQAAAEVLSVVGEGGRAPMVILIEDGQWADQATHAFLQGLGQHPSTVGLRALVLTLTRSALSLSRAINIELQPLDEASSRELTSRLLAPMDRAEPALEELLVQRAAGNPFYLEEMLQMFLAQRVIEVIDGTPTVWRLTALPELKSLPTTLHGVLQARLNTLPHDERLRLQEAAVLGMSFDGRALSALAPQAALALPQLTRRGLLRIQDVAIDSDECRYVFSHAFIQQVAYGQLLRHLRQALHGRAARWYASHSPSDAAESLPLAAEHFEQAEENSEALRYRLMAAEHLAKRFAHDAVQEQCGHALRLVDQDDVHTRWSLLLLRQRARRQSGQRDAQAQDLEVMDQIAHRTADPIHVATVAVRKAVAADETGESQLAATLAPAALEAAQKARDHNLELLAYGVYCGAMRSVGRHDEARVVGEAGLARARALGDVTMEAELLVALAAIATEQSNPVESSALLKRALYLQQASGNRFGECISRINLGTAAQQLGSLDLATREYDEAVRLSGHLGNPSFEVMSLLNRASALLPQGQVERAFTDADTAVKLAQRINNSEYEAFARMTRGACLLTKGQEQQPIGVAELETALKDWQLSEVLLTELDLSHLAIEAVAWQARGWWVGGNRQAALERVGVVWQHLERTGHLDGTENPLQILSTCIEVLDEPTDLRYSALLARAWKAMTDRCRELPDDAAREQFMRAQACHAEIAQRAQALGLTA